MFYSDKRWLYNENGDEMKGERIAMLRRQRGLSQAALGALLGVTQQSVWQWEHEKSNPDTAQLIQMADFFQVSIDYLVGRVEGPGAYATLPPKPCKEEPVALTAKQMEQVARQVYEMIVERLAGRAHV